MNDQPSNSNSHIEREFLLFLYDNAQRTSLHPVTVKEIQDFIRTPEGQRGLESFKVMRKKPKDDFRPMPVGSFL